MRTWPRYHHHHHHLSLPPPRSRLVLVIPVLLGIALVGMALYLLWHAVSEPTIPVSFEQRTSPEQLQWKPAASASTPPAAPR